MKMMLNRGCRAGEDCCLLSQTTVDVGDVSWETINQACSLLKITIMMDIEQERKERSLLAPSVFSLYG